ncbi:MAG TPA: MnhB domain-containing protein [Mycobacteriales bacterium]|nr:MnhB domain-containing protein [Mycobacteriales bacterium]HWA65363.1 MnhB domain-containing protein [Mycobacteriales bacterium]
MSRTATSAGEPLRRPRIGLAVVVLVAAGLAVGLLGLPRESAALPAIAREAMRVALPQWHTTEPVSEVVYGTRGTDTFGETFLLLAAVVSVVLFCRDREGRRGFVGEAAAAVEEQVAEDPAERPDHAERLAREAEAAEWDSERSRRRPTPDRERLGEAAPETAETMTVVVRMAVRALAPALATAGVYLFAEGYSPGGGFPAGVVVVGVLLFVYAGLGYRRIAPVVGGGLMEVIELVGALALIAIETLGLVLVGSFSGNWLPLAPRETLASGGVMQAFSVSEFFEVGTGLAIAIFAVMTMRHDWAPDGDRT